ncbi:hypothetical protein ABW19_dt0204943 [Dactylella cylindrospora]|nr:hypothetical protein ABW19_dt0204943 [Dactylella cylindrospora]
MLSEDASSTIVDNGFAEHTISNVIEHTDILNTNVLNLMDLYNGDLARAISFPSQFDRIKVGWSIINHRFWERDVSIYGGNLAITYQFMDRIGRAEQ